MIYTADGQLADLILAGISSRPGRDVCSKRCRGSGVKLLSILYAGGVRQAEQRVA